MLKRSLATLTSIPIALLSVGCISSSSTSDGSRNGELPSGTDRLTVTAYTTGQSNGEPSSSVDEVRIQSIDILIREIELEPAKLDTPAEMKRLDDFEDERPYLVSFDFAQASTDQVVGEFAIPAGTYDELKLEVDKLEDATIPGAEEILALRPELARNSVIIAGTVVEGARETPFTLVTDIDDKHKRDLDPPIAVIEGTPILLSIIVDTSTWFVSKDGLLLDPRSPDDGRDISRNVEDSIELDHD